MGKCCATCNKLLTSVAKHKQLLLGCALIFLVTLSLMLFAALTNNVCYLGIKIRGLGLLLVTVCLALLIVCTVFLLHFILMEDGSWILVLALVILVAYIGHIAGLIWAAISYAKSDEPKKSHSGQWLKTLIFIILEISWLLFIIILFKLYWIIKQIKEKPQNFEEQAS